MPRVSFEITPNKRSVQFLNGTRFESIPAYGSVAQFTPAAPGLRSAELPSEIDTSPAFERALKNAKFIEQETVHVEALPAPSLRSAPSEDTMVLRVPVPPGDKDRRVILYVDESGGYSWHFAENSHLTDQQRQRMEERGLLRDDGSATFRIPARTTAARNSLVSGPPLGSLRGPITKIGRKILKVFVVPFTAKLLETPVEFLASEVESRIRKNRVWLLTPNNYATGSTDDFADWKSLDGKHTLLLIHGIFSSVEGMISKLPRSAMERWISHYEGRVLAFNHLSVTLSPEENARFFLETAMRALPSGKFNFDVLCHSRGGIVSRALAERGRTIFPELNSDFRKVFFVASPNNGSALGDPEHMLDMIDVFTNLLTEFPDGHTMFAIETILGVVKVMAYSAGVALPGMASMATTQDGYIASVLNRTKQKSPADYGAAASSYVPRLGADNGFFTGPFATAIMGRVFAKEKQPVANDLVVPEEGVFAANGHPSFPIADPLVFKNSDAVWHGGFFSEPRTISHIEEYFGISPERPTADADETAAPEDDGMPDDASETGGDGYVDGESFLGGRVHRSITLDDNFASGSFEDLAEAIDLNVPSTRKDEARPSFRGGAVSPVVHPRVCEDITIERHPTIAFHETVHERQPNTLVVRLSEIIQAANIEQVLSMGLAAGEEQIELTVELSAPGFVVDSRSQRLLIKRERDPKSEEATFVLTAKNPGLQPVIREIIASFYRGNDCVGLAMHKTAVIPAGYPPPYLAAGDYSSVPVVLSSQVRTESDLIVFVRKDEAKPDTYDVAMKCNVFGKEYALKDMGEINLHDSQFSNFFNGVLVPVFDSFPSDPVLTDQEFSDAVDAWSAKFLIQLADVGRTLWELLPMNFRGEYIRLMESEDSIPPRSVCIYSEEMILPWELVRPSTMVNGQFKEYEPLGVSHIMARWMPSLGARPQPQSFQVKRMVLLTPNYGGKPLYWAQKESEQLLEIFPNADHPSPTDLKYVQDLLNSDGVQLVHYNGHGDWDDTGDLASLRVSETEAIQAMAFNGRRLGATAHPILYLNACNVGRNAQRLGQPGGFAANCLRSGWSGVIAPYWKIYDPQAMQFSVDLYRRLKTGISIGEALQQLRRDQPNNFTAQSYCYFGDPHARLLIQ